MDEDMNSAEEPEELFSLTYLDLAWEDILFMYVLPRLSWEDIFRLRRVSSVSWRLVRQYFAQLRSVDFSDVKTGFTVEAFQTVTGNCTNLRKVRIVEATWATDASLTSLFQANPQLRYVELSACSNLNGSCLLALAVNCKFLETLILKQSPWIRRGAIDTFVAHQRLLKHIDFSSCSSLTNIQLFPFCLKFSGLVAIHLAYIQAVNDGTLVHIARVCHDLEHLDIRSCICVTDHGIRAIADYSRKLKRLEIANCHLVTEYSLSTFRLRGNVTIDRPMMVDLPMINMRGIQV